MRGIFAGTALLVLFVRAEAEPSAIAALLEPIRAKYDLPAIGGALFTSDGLSEVGVTGVRKRGTEAAATADDLWLLGSDTKAMTAALAGTFVAEGRLSWTTTAFSLFPEFRTSPALRCVTLDQTLSHRAGFPPNLPEWTAPLCAVQWGIEPRLLPTWFSFPGTAPQQRLLAARKVLEGAPWRPPGTYRYSNTGYVVTGAILERTGGKSWETLIRERLFVPLGMRTAGCGGVGTPDGLDQPYGHFFNGKATSTNGSDAALPEVINPAGMAHMTLADWARFLTDQLRGAEGKPALLPPEIYAAMQTAPPGSEYGYGWGICQRPWAGGKALMHAGSDGLHYAVCWLAPGRDFGVLVCINQGGDKAAEAGDAAAWALIGRRLAP